MLEEKARELGRLIGQSPEYLAVKTTSEALNRDRDAVTALRGEWRNCGRRRIA